MKKHKKKIFIFFGVSFVLFFLIIILKSSKEALNFEIAFFATTAILFATFYSYKNFISNAKGSAVFKDKIDEIEDKFELYEEEKEKETLAPKEIIAEEKKRIKLFSPSIFFLTSKPYFSLLRIVSYLFMAFSVLFLIKNSLFCPFCFLLGIAGAVITVVFCLKN